MILTDITLSYPYIKYTVSVNHFTERKSTAIEWAILEAINNCEKLQKYNDVSIAALFEEIFAITDTDLMIRPCLINLQDVGAITASGIDDNTRLDGVTMGKLKLTKTGSELQQKGLLPGVPDEATFVIFFDLISSNLTEESNLYKETPAGIEVIDRNDVEQMYFPRDLVKRWIVEKKDARKRFSWLTNSTKINDVEPIQSQIFWKNVSRKIEIDSDLVWRIAGNDKIELDELSLTKTDMNCPEELAALPVIRDLDSGNGIKKLAPITELRSLISEYIRREAFFCVAEEYYGGKSDFFADDENKTHIGIVFGSDKFSVEEKGKKIIITIPEDDFEDMIYCSSENKLYAGAFEVRAGRVSKELALVCVTEKCNFELSQKVADIVERYAEYNSVVTFVLEGMGLKAEFLKYVEKHIKKQDTLQLKAQLIETINAKNVHLFGQKVISATDAEHYLIEERYIKNYSKELIGARSILKEFNEVEVFQKDEQMMRKVFLLIFDTVEEHENIDEIWNFWEEIANTKKSYLNWINKNELYKRVYSQIAIQAFLHRFGEDFLGGIKEYTPVEQIISDMKRVFVRMNEQLPEMDFSKSYSMEMITEFLVKHKDSLDGIYNEVCSWREEKEKFSSKIMEIEDTVTKDMMFFEILENMKKISEALAIFYDDSMMNYRKVFIADTSTLMCEPDMISWFEDDKAMLVIPLIVLDELDGLKTDINMERAYAAREVIRMVKKYKSNSWLNIGERSYPELLPKDLDADRNDNKILSIAVKYVAKTPIVLTEDTNFRNIAEGNGISTMDLVGLQHMKETQYRRGKEKKMKRKRG